MIDLAVEACGNVTHVGLNTRATCAAIRCGLTDYSETRFLDSNGEWIIGAEVKIDAPWRGRAKLSNMGAMAIQETISSIPEDEIKAIPILLCLAEPIRLGRIPDQDKRVLEEIQKITKLQFHPQSAVIAAGHVSGVLAVERANLLISSGKCHSCLIVGVDTFLNSETLSAYDKGDRILTESNSDGFVPGEAGAAVFLVPSKYATKASVVIKGYGFGKEKAYFRSEKPLKADGLTQAIKEALKMAGHKLGNLDYRICDVSGEQYYFKEASLALGRVLRKQKEEFDIWHPAECIGEAGAAIVPMVLAVASAAIAKGYSPGDGILCHFSNDDEQRGALVLHNLTEK